MFVNFNILNQLGSPAINSNTFANRPAAGQTGRLFVSTDTFEIYRDNGTTWDLIGGPGSSTITGTGTATQVAYFTSSQAIGSSADLYWDNTNTRLGIGTSSPGVRLDVHGTGVMMHINSTSATSNSLMSFQRTGTNVWRLGDNYNAGDNYFELRNSVLSNDALTIQATTNKAAFLSQQTYSTGQAQGALFTYNLTAPAGTTFATPNALSAVNAFLNLSLGGNATLPAGTRQGIEGNSRVSFTGAGTLTMSQGSTLRAYAAITGVHSFAGSAVGTITHLAGMRLCFPDNIGSAINITNNYGLLINDQSAGTGTITYTNRWGIYQEGASDLNYFAANLLIGSTVNNGAALQVTGNGNLSGNFGIGTTAPQLNLHIFTSGTSFTSSTVTYSSATSRGILLDNSAGTNQSGNAIWFANSGLYSAIASTRESTGDWGTDIRFYTHPTTITNQYDVTERMRISSGGNVLIGQTTNVNNYRVMISGSGGSADDLGINTNASYTEIQSFNSKPLILNRQGNNVGIGTTAPSYKLDLFDSNGSFLQLYQNDGTYNRRLIVTSATTGTNAGITMNATSSTGGDNFIFQAASNERMRITSGGNVLIGTTTDAGQKLQVNGSVSIPDSNLYRSGSNAIKSSNSITVSTSATTIFTSQQVGSVDSGNLIVVTGVLSGTGDNFCDLVLFMTNGSAVTVSSTAIGSPPARTYSVSGNNLRLTMASGTYVVGTGGFIQGYNLSF